MGTIGILSRLAGARTSQEAPIFSIYGLNISPRKLASPANLVLLLSILAVVNFIWTIANAHDPTALVLVNFIGYALMGLTLLLLPYLWPVLVTITTSKADLVTPVRDGDAAYAKPNGNDDLLVVRLASAMRPLNDIFPHMFLAHLLLFFVQLTIFLYSLRFFSFLVNPDNFAIAEWVHPDLTGYFAVFALLEFVIGRAQELVLASLLGLIAAVRARDLTFRAALVVGLGMTFPVTRLVITVLCFGSLRPYSRLGMFFLVMTGPTTTLAWALPPLMFIVVLLSLVVVREAAIRLTWRWLLTRAS